MRGVGHVAHLAFRCAWFPARLERRRPGCLFQEESCMCGFVGGTLRTILDDKWLDRAPNSREASGSSMKAQRFDAFFNRIVSMTLMNERFGMKG